MKLIAGPRQSGRTTRLVEEFLNTPDSVLLVASFAEAEYALRLARDIFMATRVATLDEVPIKRRIVTLQNVDKIRSYSKVFVDNIDYLGSWPPALLRSRIVAATVEAYEVEFLGEVAELFKAPGC